MGSGEDGLNSTTVRQTAAGISSYLDASLPHARARVVLGYDGRHHSEDFARDSAGVFHAAGHAVFLLPGPLPTPVLAFAVRELDADAGLMITASHNPATDNGIKVYLGGRLTDEHGRGAQIIPPVDALIQEHIRSIAAPPAWASGWTLLDDGVEAAYVAAVAGLVPPVDDANRVRRAGFGIALTPLHGVGGATAFAILASAGFTVIHPVESQFTPDPDFPTTPYPNPEEAGVMDAAIAVAQKTASSIALALDPDADRCGVAADLDGEWRMLTGNEVGDILGDHVATRITAGEHLPGTAPGARTLASSLVSSRRLAAIAGHHELPYTSTPTGFKWLARTPGLAFAYEEALGYCVAPEIVRDKDGMSAALVLVEALSIARSEGSGVEHILATLDRMYGAFRSRLITIRTSTPKGARTALRAVEEHPPAVLGGARVLHAEDLRAGVDGLPPTEGLRFSLDEGSRVIVRASGTEAKLKAYVECFAPSDDQDGRAHAAARASAIATDIEHTLIAALGAIPLPDR